MPREPHEPRQPCEPHQFSGNTLSEPSPTATDAALSSNKQLALAMAGVAVTVSIVAFDATIISTILPQVARSLGGMSLYAWAGTGYFLACAVTVMIFGRLGDLYGRKPLMLLSLVLVILGSVLSGLSQSMPQLVGFRVLQGFGGGMMIATAFAAPADIFPDPKQRVRWMVLLSSTYAMASGIGPVLGGVVTQAFGWRAAFFVIPVTALVAFAMVWRYFPRLQAARSTVKHRMDWVGAFLMAVTVGAPLVGIELLSSRDAGVPVPLALAVIVSTVVSGYLLLKVERRVSTPIFPLRVLQTKQARYLNIASILCGAIMFILIYYIPLQFQDVFGFSPIVAGALITPLVAGMPIGSIINGALFPRETNPQRLMLLGSVLLGVGCLLALTFTANSAVWWVLLTMALCGLGLGFLLPNFTLFMQMVADRQDVGVASALVQTARALGSAIGTALVGVAIAEWSIRSGLQIGLIGSVIACVIVGWLSIKIKMNSYTKP